MAPLASSPYDGFLPCSYTTVRFRSTFSSNFRRTGKLKKNPISRLLAGSCQSPIERNSRNMAPNPFSPSHLVTFSITERVTSAFSLVSVIFIISTFLLGRGFDKPINRLIFFASWSNLGTSIAFFISRDGIVAGPDSSLCQFQAWALQM